MDSQKQELIETARSIIAKAMAFGPEVSLETTGEIIEACGLMLRRAAIGEFESASNEARSLQIKIQRLEQGNGRGGDA